MPRGSAYSPRGPSARAEVGAGALKWARSRTKLSRSTRSGLHPLQRNLGCRTAAAASGWRSARGVLSWLPAILDEREVVMRNYEIRLYGHDSDDGEVLFEDLDRIGSALKRIVYGLTREAASRAGLGRASHEVERLATVRVGLAPGSTRLLFRVGEREALPIDPLGSTVDEAFFGIVEGLKANKAAGVTVSVGKAVGDLASALKKATPRAEITVGPFARVMVETSMLIREIWESAVADVGTEVAVHGLLEMVDLKSVRFRLVDAVGNRIDLIDVPDPAVASTLIGSRVTAVGALTQQEGARRARLHAPSLTGATSIHARLGTDDVATLDELVQGSQVVDEPEAIDLSDHELDDFPAALRA